MTDEELEKMGFVCDMLSENEMRYDTTSRFTGDFLVPEDRLKAGVEGAKFIADNEMDLHYAFKSDDPDEEVQEFHEKVMVAVHNLKIFLGEK